MQYITANITATNSQSLSRKNTGLGNTLFEVASTIGIAKTLGVKYTFPGIYEYGTKLRAHFGFNHLDTIFREIPTELVSFTIIISQGGGFNFSLDFIASVKSAGGNVIIDGYLQHYNYFKNYEEEIRNLFQNGLYKFSQQVVEDYKDVNWDHAAFIHVRRGDYVTHAHIHPVDHQIYYETARTMLPEYIKHIFVFSDDVDYVKTQPMFREMIIIDNDDELYCLAFMSMCRGAAICANSTFSWWGAFLGAYKSRAIISVPKNWIHSSGNPNGLFPLEWKIV